MEFRLFLCAICILPAACTSFARPAPNHPLRPKGSGFETVVFEHYWSTFGDELEEGPIARFDTVVTLDVVPCEGDCTHYVSGTVKYRSRDDAPPLRQVVDKIAGRLVEAKLGPIERSPGRIGGIEAEQIEGRYPQLGLSFVGRYARAGDLLIQMLAVFPTEQPPCCLESFFASFKLGAAPAGEAK